MNAGVIYGLCEPDGEFRGELRYVGRTIDLKRRLAGHLATAKQESRKSHLHNWIRKVWASGSKPMMWILEDDIPLDELALREETWIMACQAWGCRLVNMTCGGEGFVGKRPPEICAKISAWHTGRPKSAEHRAKLAAANRGKSLPLETRAKLSATLKGRPKTPEHRAKIGQAQRGRPKSPEHRANLSAAWKGKNLGKKLPPEHCSAISEGLKRKYAEGWSPFTA